MWRLYFPLWLPAVPWQRAEYFLVLPLGGTGGTYYPLGGMLAQLISNAVEIDGEKLSATAETGNASVANASLLGREGIESAFVAADILDAAFKGEKQFKGKALKNIRALGALYPETVQLVVRGNSGINTFMDIKGKSVSSGSPGSGQRQLLGDLDASLITAGSPTASVMELANHHAIKIVPLTGAPIAKLREVQPYYAETILPAVDE